jgi:hypothetical protein
LHLFLIKIKNKKIKKKYWGEFAGFVFGISDIACIFS